MRGIIHQNYVWPTNDTKFPVFLRFFKKFQLVHKKSYKFQVILRNSLEFLGISGIFKVSIFELEFLGIPRNSTSALCKLGIPTVKIHTLDS